MMCRNAVSDIDINVPDNDMDVPAAILTNGVCHKTGSKSLDYFISMLPFHELCELQVLNCDFVKLGPSSNNRIFLHNLLQIGIHVPNRMKYLS